ncbi:MAG: hypothetical protein WEA09_13000 [Gemmatimonadota bacterium]
MALPFRILSSVLLLLLLPMPGLGQELWRNPVEAGVLRILLLPGYEAAGHRLGGPGGESPESGLHPLGSPLTFSPLTSGLIPGLQQVEEGLSQALGEPAFVLPLGATQGYLKSHVNRIPLEVALGVTSRITVGGRVPFVRRRVDGGFAYLPENAEMGRVQNPSSVTGYLSSLEAALAAGDLRLLQLCGQNGQSQDTCQAGQSAVDMGRALLDGLRRAGVGGPFLPAQGTGAGSALQARVTGVMDGLASLGVGDGLPSLLLPESPLGHDDFRQLFLSTSPPVDELFSQGLEELWTLGDPEFFVLLTLMEVGEGPGRDRPRARWLAEVGGRYGTEDPAPLLPLLPVDPYRGHHAFWTTTVGELNPSHWWGIRLEGGWEQSLPRAVSRFDMGGILGPEPGVRPIEVTPGSRLRLAVSPRIFLAPQLSIGAGYGLLRWGGESWAGAAEAAPSTEGPGFWGAPLGGGTLHSLALDLSYSGLPSFRRGQGGLPVELHLRFHRTLAGRGDGLVAPAGVEAGLRIHRRLFGG